MWGIINVICVKVEYVNEKIYRRLRENLYAQLCEKPYRSLWKKLDKNLSAWLSSCLVSVNSYFCESVRRWMETWIRVTIYIGDCVRKPSAWDASQWMRRYTGKKPSKVTTWQAIGNTGGCAQQIDWSESLSRASHHHHHPQPADWMIHGMDDAVNWTGMLRATTREQEDNNEQWAQSV